VLGVFGGVLDTQLEWLFNSKNIAKEEMQFCIDVTTYKNIGGIPRNFGSVGDRFIMQPEAVSSMTSYLHALTDEAIEKCKKNDDYKYNLLTEIILYCIIQTIEGQSRVVAHDALSLPLPGDDFLLKTAVKGKEAELFERFDRRISLPPKSKLKLSRLPHFVQLQITNEFINIELRLYFSRYSVGLFGNNPYQGIMLENHGIDGQELLHKNYDSYRFFLESKITRLFPEVMNQDYYNSYEFARNLSKRIEAYWDIDYFMKEYPHHKSLYSIEYKLDSLIKPKKR